MNKYSLYSSGYVLHDCVIENGKHLLCEIPEVCASCIFHEYKGRGRKYILAAYQKYRHYMHECSLL